MSTSKKIKDMLKPASKKEEACLVVAVGASAGGLKALQEFFSHIPPKSKMAFVVLQHLDPSKESMMPNLIAGMTSIPVQYIETDTRVQPDTIYVQKPGALLEIHKSILSVHEPQNRQQLHHSIDYFFHSLAEDQGHNAVAVILSGLGNDGAAGTRSIKQNSGLVIVQKPDSAEYDGMPSSALRSGSADYILRVEEMAGKLIDYERLLSVLHNDKCLDDIEREAHEYFPDILSALKNFTTHDFSRYKRSTMVRRIRRRMQVTQTATIAEYVKMLLAHNDEVKELFKDILIGVTSFFRDRDAFKVIEEQVIPEIVKAVSALNDPGDSIRIWVPACSTGEEAYSIAILLCEHFCNGREALPITVFATDIDERALGKARAGLYPLSIRDDMDERLLNKYFVREDECFRVNKRLREIVVFSSHNIVKDPPFSRLDLVSCRNLLIYMEAELQRRIIPLFHHALRKGGFLFLGPSESANSYRELFQPIDEKCRVYQRREVLNRPLKEFPMLEKETKKQVHMELPIIELTPRGHGVGLAAQQMLLREYSPPAVIINEDGTIVYFSGRTGRYLEPPAGAPKLNVIDMAKSNLRIALRSLIHNAIASKSESAQYDMAVRLDERVQRLNLIVRPLSESQGSSGYYLVIFQELEPAMTLDEAEKRDIEVFKADRISHQLEEELRLMRDRLQSTVEELETSNEEMKSSNEELLSMNEELQSANEELQASQEELRILNEELTDVNCKLETKIDESNRANSDLQNLFRSTGVACLFLDNDLRITGFTPASRDIFNLIDSDIGRPVKNFNIMLEGVDLPTEAKRVMCDLARIEKEVWHAESRRHFIVRILPYRTVEDVIAGAVITLVDVTELKNIQEKIEHFAAIVESSNDAIIGKDLDGIITSWNTGAEQLYGYSANEAVGQSIELIIPQDRLGEVDYFFSEIKQNRRVEWFETIRRRKDGTDIHISLSLSPVKDENGRLSGVSAIARDISARKEAEERVQQSEKHLRDVLNSLTVFVGVMTPDGILTEANQSALDAASLNREDVIGRHFADTYWWSYKPEVQQQLRESIDRALEGEQVRYDVDVRLGEGKFVTIDFILSPMRDEDGNITHLVPSGIDVTNRVRERTEKLEQMNAALKQEMAERARAEREREEQWILLKNILDNTPLGIVGCDAEGKINFYNKAAVAISGVDALDGEHRVGVPDFGKIYDVDGSELPASEATIVRALRGEVLTNIERHIVTVNGRHIDVSISSAPLRREDGEIFGAVSVFADITEKRNEERALQEQQVLLQTVFEQAADGITYVDKEGNILFLNSAGRRMAGVSMDVPAHLSENFWGKMTDMTGNQIPFEQWPIKRGLAGETIVGKEIRMERKDGSSYYLYISAAPLRRADGEIFGSVAIFSDITEIKKARAELHRAHDDLEHRVEERTAALATALSENSRNLSQLEAIFDNVNQGLVLASPDGQILRINKAAALFHGLDPSSDLAKPMEYFQSRVEVRDLHGKALPNSEWTMRHALAGKKAESQIQRFHFKETGEEKVASVTGIPIRNQQGEVILGMVTIQDITDKLNVERELEVNRERLELIIKASDIGLWFNDVPLDKLNWNDTVKKHFWAEELKEVYIDDFYARLHPEDREPVRQAVEEAITEGTLFDVEYRTVNPEDGRMKWIRAMGKARYDESGTPVQFDGITIDMTEQRRNEEERLRLEAQFQQAQKMESLGVLAGGIAHDFNNLLVGILGNANIAGEEASPDSPLQEYIQGIEIASKRAAELCRQMLAYSGKGRFYIEPIDMNEVVREMHDLLQSSISKKAFLKLEFAANLPEIDADATQIRQIIMNLITNASEALQDHAGTITLRTGVMHCDREFLQTTLIDEFIPEGDYVYLEVTDTGVGMDEDTASRIFDPFFTTKFTGRGLGLAAVLGIVRGHKGAMRVVTKEKIGTTFTILLPARLQSIQKKSTETQKRREWTGGGTVLLVDDSDTVRAVGSRMLENAGFTVLLADDGVEAVEMFEKHHANIDCILLDLLMPRMDGHEAYIEMRKINDAIPVVLSSGYSEQEAIHPFMGEHLAGFVQKPYKSIELVDAVYEAIEEAKKK